MPLNLIKMKLLGAKIIFSINLPNEQNIMKITYFLTLLGKTGGPLTIYNFCNGLLKKGHEVYIVTMNEAIKWSYDLHKQFLNSEKTHETDPLFESLKKFVRPVVVPLIKIFDRKSEKEKQNLREVISGFSKLLISNYQKLDIESDIFIAVHPYTAEAVYKLGRGKKIVMHNMHFEELMFNKDDRAEISMYNNLPFQHIVNCQWLKKMFKYNYGIDSEIITPGIDSTIFNATPDEKKFFNKNLIKLITYCDPTRDFKGFKQQMLILKRLNKLNKKIEILIYGHDPQTNHFLYTFLGWVSQQQLAKYYAEAHLLVLFSWYESFPLPPIEAMASGCAVVAGKYGTEEYLINNQTGIVIDPFKIDESVKKINNLIKNPELMFRMAINGKKTSEKFSWKTQTDRLNIFLLNLQTPVLMNFDKIQKGQFIEFNKLK